jgi:hypothetical protein
MAENDRGTRTDQSSDVNDHDNVNVNVSVGAESRGEDWDE